jgi:hypothetical protein
MPNRTSACWLGIACAVSACSSPASSSRPDRGAGGASGETGGSPIGAGGGFQTGGSSPIGGGHEGDGAGAVDSGFASCATGSAAASRQPIYLMFVLDGSGSMNHDNKWVAAIGAIDGIFKDMRAADDYGVGAGLIVYSDSDDPNLDTGGSYPSSRDVPLAFVDQAQLDALIARTAAPVSPQSNTPTGRALTGAYATLASFQPQPPLLPDGKKVVVLLTDGVPTDRDCKTQDKTGNEDYTQNYCVKMAAMQVSRPGPEGPIQTFVIGTGPVPGDFATYDTYFLGHLAAAGGSGPPGCDPKANTAGAANFCYFQVDPTGADAAKTQQAFTDAIAAIRGQVSSCTLAVHPTNAGDIDPTTVNVVLNGMTILKDPMNGWTYDDPQNPQSITLHGDSCAKLKGDSMAQVSIVLGCKSEVPQIN